jgi:hypothetical protein
MQRRQEILTKVLDIVADCLELLDGYMRISRKEYNIPVIVSHDERPVAIWVQLCNEQAADAWV